MAPKKQKIAGSSGEGSGTGVRMPSRPVAVQFVWPYGGMTVFLVGSFTGWRHIQMFPMERCPTSFQVLCPVLPGIHQYKFYVDGECHHDINAPQTSWNNEIVNTIVIAPPPVTTAQIRGSMTNMDMLNETFNRMELRVSEADINLLHDWIYDLLSGHTAYDMMPQSSKVITLDINMSVKQAFHILYEERTPVATLGDIHGQFVGVLSPSDFILILRELKKHRSILTEKELETHTITAWKQEKCQLLRQSVQRTLVHAGPDDTLMDVALKILRNKVSMVPIIYSENGYSHPLCFATLSEILKYICRYLSILPPILQWPICIMELGTWAPRIGGSNERQLVTLKANASLSDALSLLLQAEVSSVPIVDDNNCLVNIYSRSDITALAKDEAYAHIHPDEMTIQQALNSPYHLGQRCQMCQRTDSLQKVMECLARPGVRRVIIVEAGGNRVEGIISLSDVFKFFLRHIID